VKRNKIKDLHIEKIYSEVKENEFVYNTLSIKYSSKINLNGKENNVNGLIRIKKDSAIWISVSPGFGVEVMRILASPDSVKLLNKLNTTYFAGDYSYLNKLFNFKFDYNSLQSIFTNEFFTYNLKEKKNPITNFTSKIESNKYFLQSLPKSNSKEDVLTNSPVMQQIIVSPKDFKITKILLFDYIKNRTLQVDYSNFEDIEENSLPKNIDFRFNTNQKKSIINLKYNKVVVNKKLKMPFKISKKYLPIN